MTRSESLLRNKNQGFTLVEILIYSALVAVVITFSLLALYQLIDASDRGRNQKELVENRRFLEQKIYWVLQSVSVINSPASGATTTSLSVDKIGFANNPVVIDVDSSTARLRRGSGSPMPITNEYVQVQALDFHQFDFSGRPAIRVSGTLFNPYSSTTASIDTTIIIK